MLYLSFLVQQPPAWEAAGYLNVTSVPENCVASSISSQFEFKWQHLAASGYWLPDWKVLFKGQDPLFEEV